MKSAELQAQWKNAVYKDSQLSLYNLKREVRTRELAVK